MQITLLKMTFHLNEVCTDTDKFSIRTMNFLLLLRVCLLLWSVDIWLQYFPLDFYFFASLRFLLKVFSTPPFLKCVFSQRLDFWVEIIFHTHTKLVSLGNNDQFKMICTTLKIYGYNKFWLFTCCWISECFRKVCVIDSSSWF